MKKEERIKALELAQKYDIEINRVWWSPFRQIAWKLIGSEEILTPEQYSYLTMNKLVHVTQEIEKGVKAILSISDKGKEKLLSLKNGR